MATAFTIDKTQKWGNTVQIELDLGAGSAAAGDTYDIEIPGGYWKVSGVWGIKIGLSAAGDSVGLSTVTAAGSASSACLVFTGVVADNAIVSGVSGAETNLLIVPGGSLRATVVDAGVGAGSACKLFVSLVQTNP